MKLRLITAPLVEPITLVEARAHLRVIAEGSPASHPEDDIISALITAARQHVDGKDGCLGRQLVPATYELVLDKFPPNEIRVPLPPLIQVISIKYDDDAGVEQTVSSDDYIADDVSEPGWIVLESTASWPSTLDSINTVRVRFEAGYTSGNSPEDASGVPEAIKRAMLLLIGHWYEERQSIVVGTSAQMIPDAVDTLLWPYRKNVFG